MDWSKHMRRIVDKLGTDCARARAKSATTETVRAIWIAPFARVLEIAPSNQPALALMAADAPDLSVGDFFTVNGTRYKAAEVEPDAVSGVAVVRLREAA